MSTSAERSYRWLFWTLALVGLCVDQGSKYGIFAGLYKDQPGWEDSIPVIPGAFSLDAHFTYYRDPGDEPLSPLRTVGGDLQPKVNHGALWGIGGGKGDEPGSDFNTFFAGVSVGAAIAIVLWSLRRNAGRDRWLSMALGLILAGTLGNLYDRLVFDGVRDFLHWNYLYDFPVFNIADSCLVCGAALLLIQAFFTEPPAAQEQQAAATTEAAPPVEAAAQVPETAAAK